MPALAIMGLMIWKNLSPTGSVAATGTAAPCLNHYGCFTDGAETPNVRLPIVYVVGHGNGVVLPSRLIAGPAGDVLRTTALRSFIDVVGATVTVNGADERS